MIRTILVLCVSFFAMSSMAWELKQPSKTAVIEMMNRWNIAVAEEKADLYFVWNDYDRFPHPTFKGGSKEAYEAFTKVLIKFLSPNNIAFIRQNNLVELPIHCNSQVQLGSFGTFSRVVRDFAQYGEMIDYTLREKLFIADQELDRL